MLIQTPDAPVVEGGEQVATVEQDPEPEQQPGAPEPSQPAPSEPAPPEPNSSDPEPTQANSTESEPTEPEPVETDSTTEPAESAPPEREPVEPEPDERGEPAESNESEPRVGEPEEPQDDEATAGGDETAVPDAEQQAPAESATASVSTESIPAVAGPMSSQERPVAAQAEDQAESGSSEPAGPSEPDPPATDASQGSPRQDAGSGQAAPGRPPATGPEAREDDVARRIIDVFQRRLEIPDERAEPVADDTAVTSTAPEEAPERVSEIEETESGPPEDVLTEMVRIPARTSRFGGGTGDVDAQNNEGPAVSVEIASFMLERHEVTNRQYKEFLDATGHEPVPVSDSSNVTRYDWDPETRTYPEGLGDYPVVNVSRSDAQAYAAWAGRRLPTEVEWEAAARYSAADAPYPWGNAFADRVFANFDAGSLVPVEQYQANELGLYDLAGNAFEWVSDAYVPNIHDDFDPAAYPPTGGEEGVLKGGAYYSTFREIRISYRENNFPSVRFFGYGFRLAADVTRE